MILDCVPFLDLPAYLPHLIAFPSCRGAFMQVQQLLQQQLGPELEVVGTQYPPPAWKAGLAQVLGMVQMGALGGVVLGEKVFEAAGVPVPQW